MADDERGPCGDADASKGIGGVSMNRRGTLEVKLGCLKLRSGTQECDKVKVGCDWKVNQAWGLISAN